MTFENLRDMFLAHTGLSSGELANAKLAVWFNEAQKDLAYICGNLVEHTYSGEMPQSGWALPEDCLVLVDADYDYRINELGKVVFSSGGKTIYYRQLPTFFTGQLADICQLPLAVQDLLPIFAAARYWDKESEGDAEESNLGTKWMNYYQLGKNTAARNLTQAQLICERWTIK